MILTTLIAWPWEKEQGVDNTTPWEHENNVRQRECKQMPKTCMQTWQLWQCHVKETTNSQFNTSCENIKHYETKEMGEKGGVMKTWELWNEGDKMEKRWKEWSEKPMTSSGE